MPRPGTFRASSKMGVKSGLSGTDGLPHRSMPTTPWG
jgi:hypothetical protein